MLRITPVLTKHNFVLAAALLITPACTKSPPEETPAPPAPAVAQPTPEDIAQTTLTSRWKTQMGEMDYWSAMRMWMNRFHGVRDADAAAKVAAVDRVVDAEVRLLTGEEASTHAPTTPYETICKREGTARDIRMLKRQALETLGVTPEQEQAVRKQSRAASPPPAPEG